MLLTFTFIKLNAQKGIEVRLFDAETNVAIQGAFFAYDSLQFGVSGPEGDFNIEIQQEALLLRISHLSYRDTVLLIEPASIGPLDLLFEPSSIALPEINVLDQPKHKFRSPVHLLRMALRAIPNNYTLKKTYPIGYYKESVTYNSCPVASAEGVFEYRLSSYGDQHSHRRAWAKTWDRRYASYARSFSNSLDMSFEHPEGTVRYPNIEDGYRSIKTRYSNFSPPLSAYCTFQDGPLDLISLDKVRLAYDFLSRRELNKYNYSIVDSVIVNGTFCYQLHFEPKDGAPTQYHGLNRTSKVAAFSGDIYIAIEDLTIVRYKAFNSKAVRRNYTATSNPLSRFALPNSLGIHVDYAKNEAGKWQLSYVQSVVASTVDTSYKAVRTLLLANSSISAGASVGQHWYGSNFLNHLQNMTYDYDSLFWADFEQSSIYKIARRFDNSRCVDNGVEFDYQHLIEDKVIKVPRASPKGNLDYVRPGQQRPKDWDWLEQPSDSATVSYLRWENDYYAQYFLRCRPIMDTVAAQFLRDVQGITITEPLVVYPDTVFKNGNEGLGFYRVDREENERLIVEVAKPPEGYVITDASSNTSRDYYYTMAVDRNYDGLLTLYNRSGEAAELTRVDDYLWQVDTLYAVTNNQLLRTNGFYRWTLVEGWVKLKEELDESFEFRLHRLPNGEIILLRESLTIAYVFRKLKNDWLVSSSAISALIAGTGPEGLGCSANIDADFIIDCRTLGESSCMIVAKDARQHLYVRQSLDESWVEISLPATMSIIDFEDSRSDEIVLNVEGVGSYGRQAVVDISNTKLILLAKTNFVIDVKGYADSILWIEVDDGVRIPCQIRWRIDQADSLKNTVLKVYGAYGNPYFMGHSETDVAMMNLGFAIVYVHTRGGGVMGPDWYDAGRAEYKIRACRDYLAVLRYFKERHPLMPTPLSGYAQSAGGPILGYAVNEQPELLDAAIFDHAFLDVYGIMHRTSLPLTQYEYLEWGDPSNRNIRQQQANYSPFQNIRSQTYPAMLFIGGLYDKSTPYWQIAQFVAALRWTNDGASNVILRTNFLGSHPGTPFGPHQGQFYEQIAFFLNETRAR